MTQDEPKPRKADWAKHIRIDLTAKAFRRLKKRGNCQAQVDYQWFWITRNGGPKVFDKNGRQLDKATLKKMLKKMV